MTALCAVQLAERVLVLVLARQEEALLPFHCYQAISIVSKDLRLWLFIP